MSVCSRGTIQYYIAVTAYMRCDYLCAISRGDMQPFVQLGLRLLQDGHRVRLATHACFRDAVTSKGLEFYPLAGDPLKLSEFMVKTQGFVIPTTPELLMEVRGVLCSSYSEGEEGLYCCENLSGNGNTDTFLPLHSLISDVDCCCCYCYCYYLSGAYLSPHGGGHDVLLLGRLRGPRPRGPPRQVPTYYPLHYCAPPCSIRCWLVQYTTYNCMDSCSARYNILRKYGDCRSLCVCFFSGSLWPTRSSRIRSPTLTSTARRPWAYLSTSCSRR